jgi:hypothetical protein
MRELAVHQYWRDTKRDRVWAVELRGGEVVSCFGPLSLGEAEADGDLLDTLDYSPKKAAWIRKNSERFRPWEPSHDVVWPT